MPKAKKPAKSNAPKEKILQPEVNIGMGDRYVNCT